MRIVVPILCLAVVAGCSVPALRLGMPGSTARTGPAEPPPLVTENPGPEVTRPQSRPPQAQGPQAPGPQAQGAQTATAQGQTPAQAAPAAPLPAGMLGQTLAGLGSPAEGGLWLRTGLVDRARPGRIQTETGQTLDVELRPSGGAPGAGSQISLAAMQALRLPLTQLVTLRVSAR